MYDLRRLDITLTRSHVLTDCEATFNRKHERDFHDRRLTHEFWLRQVWFTYGNNVLHFIIWINYQHAQILAQTSILKTVDRVGFEHTTSCFPGDSSTTELSIRWYHANSVWGLQLIRVTYHIFKPDRRGVVARIPFDPMFEVLVSSKIRACQ